MAKLPHSMRKAAVRSRSFRYSKSLETWPWSSNVFDLLFLEGKDLRQEPLSARRKLLTQVLKNAPENIRLSDELRGTKVDLFRVAQAFGLEGLVAKRKDSVYEAAGAVVPPSVRDLARFKSTHPTEHRLGKNPQIQPFRGRLSSKRECNYIVHCSRWRHGIPRLDGRSSRVVPSLAASKTK